MIRITQSYLTNMLGVQLEKNEWEILYIDFADGRRGGEGNQGKINTCFETIFDEFPDIVALKDKCLFIIEVDLGFKQNYEDKLRKFMNKKSKLVECIQKSISQSIDQIKIGMAFERKPKRSFQNTTIWILNSDKDKLVQI